VAFLTDRVVDGSWSHSGRVGEEREEGRDGVRDRGARFTERPHSHFLKEKLKVDNGTCDIHLINSIIAITS
jgi:hypothetical protein